MTFEMSLAELAAESAVELPERALMRHRRRRRHHNSVNQQMNNIAIANAVGFGAHATAVNISAFNTQNVQSFSF